MNDATSLLPALGYNLATDEVHGFALADCDLPAADLRAGASIAEFLVRHGDKQLATQVEVYLLVPLVPRMPPYILGVFAQSGSQTAETVQRRLTIAREEVEKHGSLVVGWAADGASAHFKIMRDLRSGTPGAPSVAIPNVPVLLGDATTISLPARNATFLGETFSMPLTPIFDPVHLCNLLRNAPLRKGAAMAVGNYPIDLLCLRRQIIAKLGAEGLEARLGVRFSDWEVTDRMNYAAAQRLFSTKLLSYVETEFNGAEHRGANLHTAMFLCSSLYVGTVFFLRLGNRLLRSYLDPQLTPLERVTSAFYAMFTTEVWYSDVKAKDQAAKEAARLHVAEEVARIASAKNCTKTAVRKEMARERKEKKDAEKTQKAESRSKGRRAECVPWQENFEANLRLQQYVQCAASAHSSPYCCTAVHYANRSSRDCNQRVVLAWISASAHHAPSTAHKDSV